MTFRETPRHGHRSRIFRAFALAGIAVGLALYVAAFFLTTSVEVCMTRLASGLSGSDVVVATSASAGKEWVGVVASRCAWTFATGPHAGVSVSERVVEGAPSALAGVGLVVAVAGAWSWCGLRKDVGAHDDDRYDRE